LIRNLLNAKKILKQAQDDARGFLEGTLLKKTLKKTKSFGLIAKKILHLHIVSSSNFLKHDKQT